MANPTRPRDDSGVNVRHEKSNVKAWIIGIAVLLLAIIALQNSQKVKVEFLFVDTQAPLIVALLIAAALGAVIGYTAPVMLRHRREQRLKRKQEEV